MSQTKTENKPSTPSTYNYTKKTNVANDQTDSPTDSRPRRPKTTDGRPRPKGPRVNKHVAPTPNQKTLYIGRVYHDELDKDPTISQKLNQDRLKLLKDVFGRYGVVDKFEPNTAESFVHVTYKESSSAENAITNLIQRPVREKLLEEIKNDLRQRNVPESVCPVLWKYRYEWSRTDEVPKTNTKKNESEKQQQSPATPNTTTSDQQQKKPKRQNKKQEAPQTTPTTEQQTTKDTTTTTTTTTSATSTPAKPVIQNLQLSAQHARLNLDLDYLRQQHKSVLREVQSEKERCSARDERIKRLQEEHGRVKQHAQTLEKQLNTDLTWKHAADERIGKLQEEVAHLQQQQQIVNSMLKSISEL